jgi:hypothetical protein
MKHKGKLLEQRSLAQGLVETWELEDKGKEYNAERKAYIRHLKGKLYDIEIRIKCLSI